MGKPEQFHRPKHVEWDERRRIIQFRIRYAVRENPPYAKDDLEQSIVQEVIRRGWDCYLGSVGGMSLTYGVLYNPVADMTVADRRDIAAWLAVQPIHACIGLGDPDKMGESDITRDVNELQFEVDNRTDEDRRATADWWKQIDAVGNDRG